MVSRRLRLRPIRVADVAIDHRCRGQEGHADARAVRGDPGDGRATPKREAQQRSGDALRHAGLCMDPTKPFIARELYWFEPRGGAPGPASRHPRPAVAKIRRALSRARDRRGSSRAIDPLARMCRLVDTLSGDDWGEFGVFGPLLAVWVPGPGGRPLLPIVRGLPLTPAAAGSLSSHSSGRHGRRSPPRPGARSRPVHRGPRALHPTAGAGRDGVAGLLRGGHGPDVAAGASGDSLVTDRARGREPGGGRGLRGDRANARRPGRPPRERGVRDAGRGGLGAHGPALDEGRPGRQHGHAVAPGDVGRRLRRQSGGGARRRPGPRSDDGPLASFRWGWSSAARGSRLPATPSSDPRRGCPEDDHGKGAPGAQSRSGTRPDSRFVAVEKTMPECPGCGSRVEPGDRFCPSCGREVAAAPVSAAPPSSFSAPPRAGARKALLAGGGCLAVVAVGTVLLVAILVGLLRRRPEGGARAHRPRRLG